MRNNHTEYLSKSSVGSPLTFKKSPNKYGGYEGRNDETPFLERSTANTTRKDWSNSDYQNIKRIPQDISSLRQTFDARTNARLAEKFARYDFENEDNGKGSEKLDSILRNTFQSNVSSPPNRDLTSSTYDRGYKKQESNDFLNRYEKPVKSPNSDRRVDIEQKFKKYADAVEKFKDQLETSNKMSQELRKLKEDRKRRLAAKQKETGNMVGSPQNREDQVETFKKKNYYEYYTPKYEKSTTQEKIGKEKPQLSTLNIQKYKYKESREQPKSALTKHSKNDVQLPYQPLSASMRVTNNRKSLDQSVSPKLSISDFILGKNLGQGKFGVVYQAVHRATGWLYALKKVPKDMIRSHLMVDQFILELKLQTFLNHQNVLTLYASFDDRTHVYLVLEYMEEGTLFTHFKKNKTLPEPEVAKKMRQIASSIKYLHENQIAHRDIKPENIVMSHGVCKLCDFGWATVCDDRRKTYCGTFDYAPPQILEGVEYDYTVDLWCLGVLTYELLVGKAPFYHISRKQTMKKILNVQKSNIEYPESISRTAVSFIDNLIRKDPKERMSSDVILEHPFLKNAEDKN